MIARILLAAAMALLSACGGGGGECRDPAFVGPLTQDQAGLSTCHDQENP